MIVLYGSSGIWEKIAWFEQYFPGQVSCHRHQRAAAAIIEITQPPHVLVTDESGQIRIEQCEHLNTLPTICLRGGGFVYMPGGILSDSKHANDLLAAVNDALAQPNAAPAKVEPEKA